MNTEVSKFNLKHIQTTLVYANFFATPFAASHFVDERVSSIQWAPLLLIGMSNLALIYFLRKQ